MLEKLEGKVNFYKAITKTSVQFELNGIQKIIELTISEPWVINKGDHIAVAGEYEIKTGKFVGYAYRNHTKGVFGQYHVGCALGCIFLFLGIAFSWAIFPLFIFVPFGLRAIFLNKKVNRAAKML